MTSSTQSCPFCQIVQGTKPCHKIYETADTLAFLDVNPHAYGHTLIVPKVHYRWVWDMPEPGILLNATKIITAHYRQVLHTKVFTASIIGEKVSHAHLHLLPQPSHPLNTTHDQLPDIGDLAAIAKKLKLSPNPRS
jgi:histidine triad (HIT) family protein